MSLTEPNSASQGQGEVALPGVAREVSVTNANKPRRLWENREIFTGSAYGVIVVTGPTKTLVPAAVAGLVPRDCGAESESSLGCTSLTSSLQS